MSEESREFDAQIRRENFERRREREERFRDPTDDDDENKRQYEYDAAEEKMFRERKR